jgi:hopene-associated glycosyltransferase HpnB
MAIALLALCIWVYLVTAHGRFWASSPQLTPAVPEQCPDVDVIVPARDEAQTIGAVIASLLAQNYRGNFRVTLVDDNSSDETVQLAGAASPGAARPSPAAPLHILRLTSKPDGWSGKLWALHQGLAATAAPVVLFADADIVHDPRHLGTLVAKLLDGRLGMVSEMVHLNCDSLAERALVPAFVYFFQMLYPFAKVNDSKSKVAAAAGGTILIRRDLLAQIGGLEVINATLIDDVALANAVKKFDGIYLGHTTLAHSIRPYPGFADIWRMIARTAYTQLHFSPLLLGVTLVGLALTWWVPVWAAAFGADIGRAFGATACLLAAISFQPTLRRYRRSPLWALALPLIALFYMAATLGSAINYWRGAGAQWKSRSYEEG